MTEPKCRTVILKTRYRDSKIKWKDAMWYEHYFPDGMHGVRFMGEIEIKRGDLFEIERKGAGSGGEE